MNNTNRDSAVFTDLKQAVHMRQQMTEFQDRVYINLIQQANTKYADIIKDDLGSQFVLSCGRDLAGEVVRTYFDTSDYNITVDQLAERILKFKYQDEYDPLARTGDVQKLVYNYNDSENSSTLRSIVNDLDNAQKKLFEKEKYEDSISGKPKSRYKDHEMITNTKRKYAKEHQNIDGTITDEYTGKQGEYITGKDGRTIRRQEVDHTQALNSATYNAKYISEEGAERIKAFYNSSENFAMMDKSANASKGDVRVYEKDKDGNFVKDKDGNKMDITHKATPEQYADAIVKNWEKPGDGGSLKTDNLKATGYLNEEGKVPKSVKKQLVNNIKASQNAESKVILRETKYGNVAVDAGKHTVQSIGKIVAGQVIYYTVPPLIYELKTILTNKFVTLDEAIDRLILSKDRLCKYVLSKLKTIFTNVLSSSLKKFIKSFFDILVNMVKATVKKILKMAKNLVLSVVDAIKIIADKHASPSEKADAVTNLFAVTITSFALEVLFEYMEKQFKIPEPFLLPLQTVTTIVCTNLTMLILQKADLFSVRHGFKIQNIKELFDNTKQEYSRIVDRADLVTTETIDTIIAAAKEESSVIYRNLMEINPFEQSVSEELEKINRMFGMNISFKDEWLKFTGMQMPKAYIG